MSATLLPADAKAMAMARPMPWAAPVTTMVLCSSCMVIAYRLHALRSVSLWAGLLQCREYLQGLHQYD
jgi:glycerol-3-phosphate O-acyltransferase